MNAAKLREVFHNRYDKRLVAVDSHTAGEATRLLLDGFGPVPGNTMREKREFFQAELDHIRLILNREPRGHRDFLTAAVTEPATKGADFGLIYMDARRYPFLCGHATIGAVVTLMELGRIPAKDQVVVDTPSGPMTARVHMSPDAGKVESVSIRSIPAFVYETDAVLHMPDLGPVSVDTVCIGGYFVMVDAQKAGLDLSPHNRASLIPLAMRFIDEANKQLTVRHPLRPEVKTVDVVEIYQELGPGRSTSMVVYGEAHMDRCPCGTGTTAKAALMHRRGKLKPGDTYINAGPLGTEFTAKITAETQVGDIPAVEVDVTGSAVITGFHEFVLDDRDPFPEGFLL